MELQAESVGIHATPPDDQPLPRVVTRSTLPGKENAATVGYVSAQRNPLEARSPSFVLGASHLLPGTCQMETSRKKVT